jgi:hypothetical protein
VILIAHFVQVFCIVLFLCAASLFGTIIAQVNDIVSQITTRKKDLENILSSYVYLTPRYFHVMNSIRCHSTPRAQPYDTKQVCHHLSLRVASISFTVLRSFVVCF